MGAPAALSGTDLTNLNARNTRLNVYMSVDPMTEVATAVVASFPSATPFVTLATTTESASWLTAVRKDMLIIVTDGSTGAPKAYLRVRAVPIAGTAYVEEVDYGDNGLFTIQSRPSPIMGGDNISVRETYPIFSVKPFEDNQDYNVAVGTYNTTPDSVYNVTINSKPGDYFKMVANGGTEAISAVITPAAWPTSSGATYTYSWSYPASFTGVSGGSTATLTATAPVGSHWIYCIVTDLIAGTAFTIKRWIRIHSPADPPLHIKILSSPDSSRDRTGRTVRFTLVNARAMTIPKGTTAAIWDDATWNGSDITTAAHTFVGFINNAPWEHRPVFDEQVLELIGVGNALDKVNGFPVAFNYTGNLTTWSELPSSLQHVPFAMWWILRWRTANVLSRFNFTPITYSSGLGNRKNIQVGDGSILNQLQTLAAMYFANVGSRSDGEIMCVLLPSLRIDRTSMVTRCTVDNTMYKSIKITWVQRPTIGLFTLRGFQALDDLSAADLPIVTSAPGRQAASQASGTRNETDHIFDDATQAGQIAGHALALANNPYMRVELEMSDYWPVIEPCDLQRFTIQVPAARSPSGADVSITCIPLSTSDKYYGQRASSTLVFEGETEGSPGVVFSEVTGSQSIAEYGDNSLVSTLPTIPASWGPTNTVVPVTTTGGEVIRGALLATLDGYVIEG